MNRSWSVVALVGTLMFLISLASYGQVARQPGPNDFKVSSIRSVPRVPPSFSGNNTTLGSKSPAANKHWLVIEVDFDTDLDWTDAVTLKYYVMIGQGRDIKLLTGEATHLNVAKGKNHHSALFIHPNTLDRYGRGKIEAMAVQMFYQSRLVGQTSEAPPQAGDRWWERFTPVQGELLNPMFTPWSVLAHERFEQYRFGPATQ
jgi:hypothetical protein